LDSESQNESLKEKLIALEQELLKISALEKVNEELNRSLEVSNSKVTELEKRILLEESQIQELKLHIENQEKSSKS
jgi:hypothetical protein